MNYEEIIAREIIDRFGLNAKTLSVWSYRGKIPDKYFKEGYKPPQKTESESQLQLLRDLKKILNCDSINKSAMARQCKIKEQKLPDFLLGKTVLTDDESLSLKKAINKIRLEVRSILDDLSVNRLKSEQTQKKIKDLYNRKEIHFYSVMKKDDEVYSKINAAVINRRVFPTEYCSTIEKYLFDFFIELSL